jgi:hypothetical protein
VVVGGGVVVGPTLGPAQAATISNQATAATKRLTPLDARGI